MSVIKVDFSASSSGVIRALHGVNSGPMTKVFTYDARPLFIEAGLPYARLHDVEYPYGSGEFVDIPCIFRDFDADETLPESYNFELTDEYLKKCIEVGCEPFFRLGVSIEHAPVKRHVFPPKDFSKWARICEHIIRHYTEGWADGFCWNIKYWEIWNEADGCAKGSTHMWCGTPEQFFELYCVSTKQLKSCFPHLKIGGCAFTRAKNEFIEDFFKYISTQREYVPLDFFSWHRYYSDIETMITDSASADELKARYGYAEAENIFNEWNYMRDWSDQADSYVTLKNYVGAAFCGATLAAMQSKTNIDVAAYFEADVVKEWCGIFDVDKMGISRQKAVLKPRKPFYAFKAFNELYKLRSAYNAECDDQKIYTAAASNGTCAAIIAANYNNADATLTFDLSGLPETELEIRVVDEEHNFEPLITVSAKNDCKLTLQVKNNSFVYVGSKI